MAGNWIKWIKGLSKRREVLVLARKLNISAREAASACMEMWEWADDETVDGHIQGATGDDLDRMLGLSGFAVALEAPEVCWLKVTGTGISFPRWERNNGETAKSRATESSKKRLQRELCRNKASPKKRDKCPQKTGTEEGTPLLFSYSSLPPVLDSLEFRKRLEEWIAYKAERRETYKQQGLAAMISRAAKMATKHGVEAVMDAMETAMANHWQGWDQASSFTKGKLHDKQSDRRGPGQVYNPTFVPPESF